MPSECDSEHFADFGSSGSDDTLELPSFAHIFQTDADLVEYAQGQAIRARYVLIIARPTRDDTSKKTRVYLQCNRGSLPKAEQESTRLIDCKFQLAGHRRDQGQILLVDQSKGKLS